MANKLGLNVVRYLTLGLNGLFILTGILLIALGGYALDRGIPGLSSKTIAAGVVVLGVLVFVISFVGFWGAIRENRFLLIVYFSVVLLFVVIEFALGIAAYVKRDDMPVLADAQWTLLYNTERQAIEDIESAFQCCGWYNETDRAVPPRFEGDLDTCLAAYPNFRISCNATLVENLEASLQIAGGAAIAIAVIQIVCLIFACYLFVKIPKNREHAQELEDTDL